MLGSPHATRSGTLSGFGVCPWRHGAVRCTQQVRKVRPGEVREPMRTPRLLEGAELELEPGLWAPGLSPALYTARPRAGPGLRMHFVPLLLGQCVAGAPHCCWALHHLRVLAGSGRTPWGGRGRVALTGQKASTRKADGRGAWGLLEARRRGCFRAVPFRRHAEVTRGWHLGLPCVPSCWAPPPEAG